MIIHEDIEQGSYEWHKLRKNFVTGTSVGRLLGKTTFQSEISNIIGRRLSEEPEPPGYSSSKMERGLELEPQAIMEYEMETGNDVTRVGFVQRDDISGLSPDGLVFNKGEQTPVGAIEIICPDTGNHIHHIRMNISAPAKKWQIANYFYCMPIEWLDFISYDDRIEHSIFIKRITRDDVQSDVDKIAKIVEQAWEEISNFNQ